MTLRTERPPVRPRSGRRPLPRSIFLLVLAVRRRGLVERPSPGQRRSAEAAAACASAEAAPPSLDPTTVLWCASSTRLTRRAWPNRRRDLTSRGFTVAEVANDPSDREVTGTGEVRHGRRGDDAAAFLARVPARCRRLPRHPRHRRGSTSWSDRSSTALATPRRWRRPRAAGGRRCSSASGPGRPPGVTPGAARPAGPRTSPRSTVAATIAIGSANARPGRPVTTRPASAATSAPAAWSQG